MQSTPQWKFATRGFNDVEQEVTEGDQFNNETVENVEALVREGTQNSQDAAVSATEPVRVRIAMVDAAAGLDVSQLKELTESVQQRMSPARLTLDADAVKRERVLVIEDFGTEGLTGKVDDDADTGHWRSFFFRHGGSFKKGGKNGRWGLGKLVFPMFSATRCFFGLTIRKGEGKPLVMGQAVLRTHRVNNVKFAPHGHFGRFVSDEALPIDDPAWIDKFRKGFGITRTNEPGLSVVVPYPLEGAEQEALLKFVVLNYAYPVLTNRLVVDVLGTEVNATNLKEIGHKYLDPELIDFIERVHAFDVSGLTALAPNAAHEIDEGQLGTSLDELRHRYSDGDLLGFRIKVRVNSRKDGVTFSHIDVYLKSSTAPDAGAAIFVRGDITVPGEAAARFRTKGAYAVLIARDEAVSEFLADAENPAHTHWSMQADRLKQNWRSPNVPLKLIRNAPAVLHKLLASGVEHEDETALLDVFSVIDPESPHKGGAPKPKQKVEDEDDGPIEPPEIPPGGPRKIILTRREGGFVLKPGPAFKDVELPAQLKVKVAYDIENGNAVKAWDRLDFAFEEAKGPKVGFSGATCERAGNEIIAQISDPDFELTADGFDVRRDLVVEFRLQ